MSDNIPFDIQMKIIQKVSNVKSLVQFRSVSKQWKSFIDSSDFIKGYGAHHTNPHSHILSYNNKVQQNYTCLVDDDIETFKVRQQDFSPFVVSPLVKQCSVAYVVGACHGLLCLFGFQKDKDMLVIWNPTIGKSFGIAHPRRDLQTLKRTSYGFGVCPVTSDPTVVKFVCENNMPWYVEVFRLSTGVWNVIPSSNLPRQTIRLERSTQVVVDKFIYWGVWEKTKADHGESTINHMVVSFYLITEEFKVVNLPDTLTNKLFLGVSISKLRGSFVVCGCESMAEEAGVWVMENDSSFRKLFTIVAPVYPNNILGFKNNGEIIIKTRSGALSPLMAVLDLYDPCSKQVKNLGISGVGSLFFMGSYKESLLLLDHLDSHIYYNNN